MDTNLCMRTCNELVRPSTVRQTVHQARTQRLQDITDVDADIRSTTTITPLVHL